ncbi:MAG: FHA domain-containing protein [Myxococcota bacterium]
MPTVLTTTLAFGGTRFGPFTSGNVSVGSDPQCQVLVSAELGVLPLHAWVTERPGGWTLHPGAPGAVVFVTRQGGRVTPITAPVELEAGDGFVLANREGVAFVVGGGAPAVATPGRPATAARPTGVTARPSGRISPSTTPQRRAPSGPRRGPPTAGALADEAQRMVEVEMMRYGPLQQIRQVIFRYNSGTYFQPRYIMGALFAAASGSFVMCSGGAAFVWAWLQAQV